MPGYAGHRNTPGMTMTIKYPWQDAWEALKRTIEEERDSLKQLVDNEDTACNARNLRRARMNELENTLHHMSELERWEW
jgi:hypothetical protein